MGHWDLEPNTAAQTHHAESVLVVERVGSRGVASWRDAAEKQFPVDPEYGDWVLTLRAMPRATGSRVIQAWSSRGWSGIVGEELYEAVRKKARKFKDPDHPLVVAVNITAISRSQMPSCTRRLPTVRPAGAASPPQLLKLSDACTLGRDRTYRKALWFDNRKRRRHYPQLSAVMMFHDLAPWTVANVSACLYLNFPYVRRSRATGAADPGLRRGGRRATPAVRGRSFSQGRVWAAGRLAWQL